MNWSQWLQWMLTTLQLSDSSGTTAFTNITSLIIALAEGRIYRDPELDFLATRMVDVSQQTIAGNRSVPIPSTLIVIDGVNLITPANTKPSVAGSLQVPLQRTTRSFIDMCWPYESVTQAPNIFTGGYFSVFSQQQAVTAPAEADELPRIFPSSIQIMPTPDDAYYVEFTGTFRPAALSATNTTTFLTTYLPDLFFCASMVAASGYQRDYGRQSDDPQMAMSWERLFQDIKRDAGIEELRKKSLIDGYSSQPAVTPTGPQQLAQRAAAFR